MNTYLPLYAQVRETLIKRISANVWSPGAALPSETALAAELGVSQGTVRKALDSLCADGALVRSQGRGTFVAVQTVERSNFRFFRLTDRDGQLVMPELSTQTRTTDLASAEERRWLTLAAKARVHRIDRVRKIDDAPAILESISLPAQLFPRFEAEEMPPNALYPYYQRRFGISVLRTEDRLTATLATDEQARLLGLEAGTSLLSAHRVAFDLMDRAVELRVSHFLTRDHAFVVSLS